MFFFIFICFELEYTVLINHLLTEMHMQVHRDCIFWVWGRGDKPIWSIGFVVDPVDIQWAVWIFEVHIVVYLSALGLKAMLFRKGFEKTKQQKGREVVTVQLSTLYHIYIYYSGYELLLPLWINTNDNHYSIYIYHLWKLFL